MGEPRLSWPGRGVVRKPFILILLIKFQFSFIDPVKSSEDNRPILVRSKYCPLECFWNFERSFFFSLSKIKDQPLMVHWVHLPGSFKHNSLLSEGRVKAEVSIIQIIKIQIKSIKRSNNCSFSAESVFDVLDNSLEKFLKKNTAWFVFKDCWDYIWQLTAWIILQFMFVPSTAVLERATRDVPFNRRLRIITLLKNTVFCKIY